MKTLSEKIIFCWVFLNLVMAPLAFADEPESSVITSTVGGEVLKNLGFAQVTPINLDLSHSAETATAASVAGSYNSVYFILFFILAGLFLFVYFNNRRLFKAYVLIGSMFLMLAFLTVFLAGCQKEPCDNSTYTYPSCVGAINYQCVNDVHKKYLCEWGCDFNDPECFCTDHTELDGTCAECPDENYTECYLMPDGSEVIRTCVQLDNWWARPCHYGCRDSTCLTELQAPRNVTVTGHNISGIFIPVTFLWSPVPGAESYYIMRNPDGNPSGVSDLIVSAADIEAVTTTGYNISVPKRDYEYYSFDVVAMDATGPSPPTRTDRVDMPLFDLTVVSPNGGERLVAGENYTITWNSTGNISDVNIYFYVGEVYTDNIAVGTPNDGSYDWTIPFNWSNGGNYRIKLFEPSSGGAVQDLSDGYFNIIAPPASINVTSDPIGAEVAIDEATKSPPDTTPVTITPVDPGIHNVTVSMAGYETYSTIIDVAAGETEVIDVDLVGYGDVSLTSEPNETWIRIDGEYTGLRTPVTIENLTEGVHEVKFSKLGYASMFYNVTVTAGDITNLHGVLPSSDLILYIISADGGGFRLNYDRDVRCLLATEPSERSECEAGWSGCHMNMPGNPRSHSCTFDIEEFPSELTFTGWSYTAFANPYLPRTFTITVTPQMNPEVTVDWPN